MRASGLLLALSILSAGAVACGSEEPRLDQVVLYTSMPDSVVNQLVGVVEQRFPDLDGNFWMPTSDAISLRVVRGRTADIQQRIAEDMARGGIEADVIWLAEPSPYETYKDMGLLAPYDPPSDAAIPPEYIDPDGFYVAGRIIMMVIAWNTSVLPGRLADWTDLHDVELAAFPAPESGAARATIRALNEEYGSGFFTTFAEAGGISVPSNGAARDGVADRTFEAVAVLDYMARQEKASGSAIDFVYPASGTVVIPSPIAITASSGNRSGAEAFVDFILSAPGQEILVQIGSFYPVRTDVAAPIGAPPLDTISALDVDWNSLATEIDEISTFWKRLFGTAGGAG